MVARHEIYQALGDPTRLEIVDRLGSRGPMPTLELVEGLGMSRQAATKHLLVLENVGLVVSRTQGRQVVRELRMEVLEDAGDWLAARAKAWNASWMPWRSLLRSLKGNPLDCGLYVRVGGFAGTPSEFFVGLLLYQGRPTGVVQPFAKRLNPFGVRDWLLGLGYSGFVFW